MSSLLKILHPLGQVLDDLLAIRISANIPGDMPQQEPDQLRIARQLTKWTAIGVMVAALALVAATVYAYIAFRQLEQMRSSAMVDQRSGIYPEGTAWGFI